MAPRVVIVGAGGLGGVVAARLRRAGHDVPSLVRPGATADALRARGFRLDDGGERLDVPARVLLSLDGEAPYDLAVLTTQPTDVEAAAAGVLPHLAPTGALVVLQNGLCEPRLAALAGADRVLGAVVSWGASVEAPGHVRRTSRGRFTLGRWDGRPDPRLTAAASLLEAVAPCRVTSNLPGVRWSKLAFNCAISTLGTIGGGRVGPLVAHPFVRRLTLEILTEAAAVARAEGVRTEKIAGTVHLDWLALRAAEARSTLHPGYALKSALVRLVGLQIRDLRSSMLRAIEQGRPPAIDFLNGEIVDAARRHGLPAPVNAAAADMVRRIAAGARPASPDTLRELYAATRT